MKKVLITLILVLTFVLPFESAMAKSFSKDLITRATLSRGLSGFLCPVDVESETVKRLLSSSGIFPEDYTVFNRTFECTGQEEKMMYGEVLLNFKDYDGESKIDILLFNDMFLRCSSALFDHYEDNTLGGKAPPNAEGVVTNGLRAEKCDAFQLTTSDIPQPSDVLETSGFYKFYDEAGNLNAIFIIKGQVYKVANIVKEVENVVLVDYTTDSTATPTETSVPTATESVPEVTYIPSPSPTPVSVSKYFLEKSVDSVRIDTKSTGYSIAVTLRDENGNVVTDQLGVNYNWSIDDPEVLKGNTFPACTQGIKTPCPNDHFLFGPKKAGSTNIRVEVNNGPPLGTAVFPITVEEVAN